LVFLACIGISYGIQYHNEVFAALAVVWGWIELLGEWLISTALPWLLSSIVVILGIVFDSLVLFFTTLGILSLVLLTMLLAPVLLFVIVRFQAKQHEQSSYVNKIHEFVSKILPKVKYLIIPFALGILYFTPRDLLVLYAIAIGVLLIIYFLASKYLWNNHIKYDKRIKDIVLLLMEGFNLSKNDATEISYAFVNNRWLSQFKKIEGKEKVLDEIEIFTKRIFPRNIGEKREMQHYFLMLNLVAEVNKRSYSVITGINKAGGTYRWKNFDKNQLTYSDIEEVVRIILKTKNFKDLFNNISTMEKAKYQKNVEDDVKVKQFFETVTTPFRKARDFFAAIYGLLQLFNKRCPYIDKQKVIL
jgi:hypothetical protein